MKKRGIKGEESPKRGGGDLLEERKKKLEKRECVQCIIGCNTQTLYARD